MKNILALLATVSIAQAATIDVSVLTSAASYHWHRRGQQEINPGVGISASLRVGGDWSAYAQGMIYDDSHGNTANYELAGVRYGQRWGFDFGLGYQHSTTREGFAAMPSVYGGTDRVHIHIGALGTRALGFWVRWDL